MATLVTSATTAGYVDPVRGIYEPPAAPAGTDVQTVQYTRTANRGNYVTRMYYFTSVADGNTWTSPFPSAAIKGVFTSTDDVDDATPDTIGAYLADANGTIQFTAGATGSCFLLLLIDPALAGRGGEGTGR